MPNERSSWPSTASASGSQKLGHPVPLSNFVFEEKSGQSQPAQANVPARFSCNNGLVNGGSVPASRNTTYCSAVRRRRHSSGVSVIRSGAADASIWPRVSPTAAPIAATATVLRKYRRLRIPASNVRPVADFSQTLRGQARVCYRRPNHHGNLTYRRRRLDRSGSTWYPTIKRHRRTVSETCDG